MLLVLCFKKITKGEVKSEEYYEFVFVINVNYDDWV